MMLTMGTHMSIADGIAKTAENVVKMEANTMQIFSRNPRGSGYRNYSREETERFWNIKKENNFGPLLAHAPYTMNLASPKEATYEFACMVLKEDIARMDALGMEAIVFHPGSHTGIGAEAGIQKIIAGLNQAITGKERITVLLETMSGKGSEVGRSFEELREILDRVSLSEHMGVCLDTCHVWDGGYDIVSHLDEVLHEFDQVIGLQRLKAVHLNDSLNPLGSHKDRHAKIGEGQIGKEALIRIINHPALRDLPFYLETPNDLDGYAAEISLLRENYQKERL